MSAEPESPVVRNARRSPGGTKRPKGSRVLHRIVLTLAVLLIAVFVLGPVLWLSLRAFATTWTFPNLWPDGFTLAWWQVVLDDPRLATSIRNSLLFAVTSTVATAVICLPAAYAFGWMQFPGRTWLLIGLFATNAFPKMGLFVAIAALYYAMGLMTTFIGVVIVHVLGSVVFMVWIPAAAFAAVPPSLEEAARDAGAGRVRVFCSVTLPMAAPGILVAMIMTFIGSWDEAQGTYLVGAPVFMTMPTELYSMVLNYPQQVAAVFSVMLTIPSVALLLLVRRHIMGGHLAEGFQLR